jgi:hypothetical protein
LSFYFSSFKFQHQNPWNFRFSSGDWGLSNSGRERPERRNIGRFFYAWCPVAARQQEPVLATVFPMGFDLLAPAG